MTMHPIHLPCLLVLFVLTACTDAETEERQGINESISSEESRREISVGSDEPREDISESNQIADEPDVFARLEECELTDDEEGRIREATEDLRELRLVYSERHPSVASAQQVLEELQRAALSDCVESLQ